MKINFESLFGVVPANREVPRVGSPSQVAHHADALIDLIGDVKGDGVTLYELIETAVLKVRADRIRSGLGTEGIVNPGVERTGEELREFLAPEIDLDNAVTDEHAAARLEQDEAEAEKADGDSE